MVGHGRVHHAVAMANWSGVLRQATKIGLDLLSSRKQEPAAPPRVPARSASSLDRARTIIYSPDPDGTADPGEIVWAWVPFEENDGRGKDRPILVVGRQGGELVGLMLSSQLDHAGEWDWISIGSGPWDRQGRESFVRLDRVLEVGEHEIRREGAVLDRHRFERVAGELRTRFGWR
jgi:hypothetical protein